MHLQSLVKKNLDTKHRWFYFEYKVLLRKSAIKMTQKNWSNYLKTNEVGITISKLFLISLSKMIQWKQTLNYASNKAFRESRFLIKKSWEADLIDGPKCTAV